MRVVGKCICVPDRHGTMKVMFIQLADRVANDRAVVTGDDGVAYGFVATGGERVCTLHVRGPPLQVMVESRCR